LEWIPLVGDAFQCLVLRKYCIAMGLHTRRENASLSESISGRTEKSVRLCYVGESQFISFSPPQYYIFTWEHMIWSGLCKFQHYVFFTQLSLWREKHILTDATVNTIKLSTVNS